MTIRSGLAAVAAFVFAVPVIATWHEGVPLSLRAISLVILLASAVRPVWGVLLVCGLLPLATPIAVLTGAGFGGAGTVELLVPPLLTAVALREVIVPGSPLTRLRWPAVTMAALVASSALVQLAGQTPPSEFGASLGAALWRFASGPYFVEAQHFPPLHETMVWMSGLALTVVVERVLRTTPDARLVVTRMAIFGAAAAAAFAANRLAEISLRREDPIAAAVEFLVSLRFNPHFGDLNAGGSFYALFAVPTAWLAVRGRCREMWLAFPLIVLGLWSTGSRTALAAVVLAGGLVWAWDRRVLRRALPGMAAVLVLAWLVTVDPGRDQASPGLALGIRARLAPIALQLATYQPVFGLGLRQFLPASAALFDEELRTSFPHGASGENAHNNYLQILVELGLAGLAAWLWMLATIFIQFSRARAAGRADPALIGFAGGLVAFLVTCLAGHPLLTPQVLLPFSLVLGLTAGLLPDDPTADERHRQKQVALGALVVIALSLVWRLT